MNRKLSTVALLAILAAASALAHFQEWTLQSFLSRCSDTREGTITDFNSFKPEETIIVFR